MLEIGNFRDVKYQDALCAILEMCEMWNVWEEKCAIHEMGYGWDVKCKISIEKCPGGKLLY